jgi:hypothetical protein
MAPSSTGKKILVVKKNYLKPIGPCPKTFFVSQFHRRKKKKKKKV